MKKNNYAFSLPLAMGIVVIMSLLAYTMLEYIVPFSRDIKGVENSSKAYYQASSSVEEGLYYLNVDRTSETSDISIPFPPSDISNTYKTVSIGSVIPPAGEGNSQYDPDWNTISQGNPIQLSVGYDKLSDGFEISFRLPNTGTDLTLSGSNDFPYINWQLSSETNTLYASGSIFKKNDISSIDKDFDEDVIKLYDINLYGYDLLSSTERSFENFYFNECGSSSGCILKLSIVNSLVDLDGTGIPFIEWSAKIDSLSTKTIPLRYIKLETSGKSMGFRKDIEVKIPTETVNEAFDFTVFQ